MTWVKARDVGDHIGALVSADRCCRACGWGTTGRVRSVVPRLSWSLDGAAAGAVTITLDHDRTIRCLARESVLLRKDPTMRREPEKPSVTAAARRLRLQRDGWTLARSAPDLTPRQVVAAFLGRPCGSDSASRNLLLGAQAQRRGEPIP